MDAGTFTAKDGPFAPFEWQIDQDGYKVGHTGPSGSVFTQGVQGKGGPLRAYRLDLDGADAGLFRQFAALNTSQENILRFANERGCLWSAEGEVEGFFEWYYWIGRVKSLVTALDEGRHDDFWEEFNNVSEEHRPPVFVARIEPHVVPNKSRLKLIPKSLLAAMWLQAANASIKSIALKQCEFCPHWFPVGPGTGRKPSKRFCSNRCRVAWNRKHKSGDTNAR
jgi:hypothetical protein